MKNIICFVLGATAGTLITWKLLEKKYKDIADYEIEEIRKYYKSKEELAEFVNTADKISYAHKDVSSSIEPVEKEEYDQLVEDSGYTIEIDQDDESIAPYTIAPDEYGDLPGFDTKEWIYYKDAILTDEDGEIVSNPENIIGDALTRFGEYEDDSVCVRNENNECDYQILLHDKTFDEVKSNSYYGID